MTILYHLSARARVLLVLAILFFFGVGVWQMSLSVPDAHGAGTLNILSVTPSQSAHDVVRSSNISVVFDQAMNLATATTTNMPIYGEKTGRLAGVYSLATTSIADDTIVFNPTTDFAIGERIHVVVTTNVKSTMPDDLAQGQVATDFRVEATQGFHSAIEYDVEALVTASDPDEVVTADFDGDGDMDAASAHGTGSILLNDGSGNLALYQTIADSVGTFLVAGDFDNDGDVDLAFAGGDVRIYENDGSANFSHLSTTTISASLRGLVTADFDGDGDLDLAVGSISSDGVRVLDNDGSGTFTLDTLYPFALRIWGGATGDFDNDGDADFVYISDTGFQAIFFENDATGAFTTTTLSLPNMGTPQNVDAGDINGDGDLDLAVGGTNGASITLKILENDGAGNFSLGDTLQSSRDRRNMLFGDIDADGDLDLSVTSLFTFPHLEMYRNTAGSFTSLNDESTHHSALSQADGISLADMDNDGDLDYLVADRNLQAIVVFLNEFGVTRAIPAPHEIDVSVSSTVQARFGQDVNAGTVDSSSFIVWGEQSGVLSGAYSTSGQQVTFTPDENFLYGDQIHFLLTTAIQSTGGDPLPASVQYSFDVETLSGPGEFTLVDTLTVPSDQPAFPLPLDIDNDLDPDVATENSGGGTFSFLNNGVAHFSDGVDHAGGTGAAGNNGRSDVGDFNGDGYQDFVASYTDGANGTVQIMENDTSGGFTLEEDISISGPDPQVTVGDFNNDGRRDVAVAILNTNELHIYRNDGGGTYTDVNVLSICNADSIESSDLDKDGDIDIVIGCNIADSVRVYRNDGALSFTQIQDIAIGNRPMGLQLLDVDDDQDIDIATSTIGGVDNLFIYKNDGTATFTLFDTVASGNNSRYIEYGDVDGDGDLDLGIVNFFGLEFRTYLNNGSGTYTLDQTISLAANPYGVGFADYDGDGDLDFVTAKNSVVEVYLNQFPPMDVLSVTPAENAIDVASGTTLQMVFDDSLNPASVTQANFPVYGSTLGRIDGVYSLSTTSVSDDTVTFTPSTSFPAGERVSYTASDQVASTGGGVVRGGFSGGFTVEGIAGNATFTATDYATAVEPFDATSGDFNGDGFADLVTANRLGDSISVLMNDGAGGFLAAVNYSASSSDPVQAETGDVDNDGDVDIVISYNSAAFDNVSVFYNDGSGAFPTRTEYPSGDAPFGLSLADFNGDSFLDLGVSNRGTATLGVMLNNGSGGFLTSVDYSGTGGSTPFINTAQDFDNDGDIDVAIAGNASNSFMVFLNEGDAIFAASVDYPTTGSFTNGIDSADFNADGYMDIITADDPGITNDEVHVFFNDGDGTFTFDASYVSGGTGVWGLDVGDFDADGDIDFLATNQNEGTFSLFFNDGGNGTFGPPTTITGGSVNLFSATGDYNNDGGIDIAIPNTGANDVSVYLNTVNQAPVATVPTNIVQTSGIIEFQTTISDADLDTTILEVQYSDDGGSTFYDPWLLSVTPDSGTTDVNNVFQHQIGSGDFIDTDGGAVTLTIEWDTQSASNGNGVVAFGEDDLQLRVIPNDGTEDGTAQTTGNFALEQASGGRRRQVVVEEPLPQEEEVVTTGKGLGDGDEALRGAAETTPLQREAQLTALDKIRALILLFDWMNQADYQLLREPAQLQQQYQVVFRLRDTIAYFGDVFGYGDGYSYREPEKLEIENIAELLKVLVFKFNTCFGADLTARMLSHDTPANGWWWAGYWHVLGALIQQPYELWDPVDQFDMLRLIERLLTDFCSSSSL